MTAAATGPGDPMGAQDVRDRGSGDAVPPEDRVWRDQRRHVAQDPSSKAVAFRRQSAPLGVGQPQAPPTQVFLEDSVLGPQVVDDVELVAIHPARERNEEDALPDRLNHEPNYSAGHRHTGRSGSSSGPDILRVDGQSERQGPEGRRLRWCIGCGNRRREFGEWKGRLVGRLPWVVWDWSPGRRSPLQCGEGQLGP